MQNQMATYVRVTGDDGEVIELPTEYDGSMLLSTLQAQYPAACGLKYLNVETMSWRGVRIAEGVLSPPLEGWGDVAYVVVNKSDNSTKRKIDESVSPGTSREPETKMTKVMEEQCLGDLIVLGLPWKCSDEDMRAYFEKFGDLEMVEVKKDYSGQSRGFGFVGFKDNEVAKEVMNKQHIILGRRVDIRQPRPRDDQPKKLFVGRLNSSTTEQDLRQYFEKFGDLSDVYIPKPFRGFAFVTFVSGEVAARVQGMNHSIKGAHANITIAEPKGSKSLSETSMGFGNLGGGYGHSPSWGKGGSYNNAAAMAAAGFGNMWGMGQLAGMPVNGMPGLGGMNNMSGMGSMGNSLFGSNAAPGSGRSSGNRH